MARPRRRAWRAAAAALLALLALLGATPAAPEPERAAAGARAGAPRFRPWELQRLFFCRPDAHTPRAQPPRSGARCWRSRRRA
jgi:hypothetical protein